MATFAATMPRILAIDYGLKRTGLAWTDPLKIIASGLGYVETAKLEAEIKKIVSGEIIESIVVGYPTRADGSDTDATSAVRSFIEKLRKLFPDVPVIPRDERFTSARAVQSMIEAGVPKGKRRDKGLVDQVSATLILQEYLDSIR